MINYFNNRRDLSLLSFIPNKTNVTDKIEKGKPRFVIWSGHDTTVGGTQMFFNELNKELNVSCDPNSEPSKIGESCENNITQFKVNPTFGGNVFIEFHINDTFLNDETKNITSEDEFDKYNNNFFVKYYINGQEYYTYNYTEFLGNRVAVVIAIAAAGVVYLGMIFLLGAVTKEDMQMLPKSEKLIPVMERFKLIRR